MIDWTPNPVLFQIGGFPLNWYGIAYAVGLGVAYWVMVRQARRLGEDPSIIGNSLVVIAVAALIGGRLYHVIDQWQLYADCPIKIVIPIQFDQGCSGSFHFAGFAGLGVFGGFITGALAFIFLATRWYKVSAWRWADIVAPGLFAMQAIGRWGNFFNQELYGPPTTLPWGIRIDCAHRVVDPAANIDYSCTALPLETTHFHPLFLYESVSALIGLAVILWLTRRPPSWLRRGDLTPIAVIWIGAARFLIEFLRIGNWRLGEIPTAQIIGAGFVVTGVALLWLRRRQDAPAFLDGVVPIEDEDREGDGFDDDDDEDLEDDGSDDDDTDLDDDIDGDIDGDEDEPPATADAESPAPPAADAEPLPPSAAPG
ncbi:MAG TPA: prolipoprotein diacylglyceryl transferase [Candidatus Limnocylindrales bacterium]